MCSLKKLLLGAWCLSNFLLNMVELAINPPIVTVSVAPDNWKVLEPNFT